MNNEIERKFLVSGDFKNLSDGKFEIKQGYLSSDPNRTVRIRITDKKGFITIKGKSDETGMKRLEWEKEISVQDAKALFELCEPNRIEKTRYIIDYEGHLFEVDEFYGENMGLIIAEVEMQSINEEVSLPNWIGKEVTNDKKYYNSQLTKYPFKTWQNE